MVKREMFRRLEEHLPRKEFSILTGARQTGKSTLLRQLEQKCRGEQIPSVFLNLEHKPLVAELNANPLNLFRYLPATNDKVVVFIDEIQYLDDPSNFLKLIFDEHVHQIKIVASGSSAFYIDRKFKDSLAGRKRLFQLNTCSFPEFLRLKGRNELLAEFEKISSNPDKQTVQLSFLQLEWEEYLIYGAYPAVILERNPAEKVELLRELRDSFIKKDMDESGVKNEFGFYNLLRILAAQSGSMLNTNELSSTLRMKHETISNHLWIMQKSFHISLTRPFHGNLRKELVKMPKAYFLDTGLRNCLLDNFQPMTLRADRGELWETMVFKLLSDKFGSEKVFFWRTSDGKEVDFILPGISEPFSIEVKYDISQVRKNKYRIFTEAYPQLPLQFVHMHPFSDAFFRTQLFSPA